ncbi:hypothetical protein MMC28_009255 [Mycoblastus sanguinarius]|nr:hypothetical protein [Mycoblastus sanguinarius]
MHTCRLVYLEASEILYQCNVFHFDDPVTAENFRWRTDKTHSCRIKETGIVIKKAREEYGVRKPWKLFTLSKEFPHLKRLTIRLTRGYHPEGLVTGQSLHGLDWIHVVGLYYPDMVDCLTELVQRRGANSSEEQVQRNILELERHRKSVVLWWGRKHSKPPDRPIRDAVSLIVGQ